MLNYFFNWIFGNKTDQDHKKLFQERANADVKKDIPSLKKIIEDVYKYMGSNKLDYKGLERLVMIVFLTIRPEQKKMTKEKEKEIQKMSYVDLGRILGSEEMWMVWQKNFDKLIK